jgi:hypothetical protein
MSKKQQHNKYQKQKKNREKPNKCKQNITSSSPPYCSSKALFVSSFVTCSSSNLNLKTHKLHFLFKIKVMTKKHGYNILDSTTPQLLISVSQIVNSCYKDSHMRHYVQKTINKNDETFTK